MQPGVQERGDLLPRRKRSAILQYPRWYLLRQFFLHRRATVLPDERTALLYNQPDLLRDYFVPSQHSLLRRCVLWSRPGL
jgi:hypothetical protein